jgi:ribosome-binding protein aMBF1 (putative translation factor)
MSTKKVDANQNNKYAIVMSPEQIRAARNWLAWTQAELAEKAKVGLSTIKDYESGKRTPIANNVEAVQRALESAGMVFTADTLSGPIKDRSKPPEAT